mmetsp:Transcript_24317/g.50484  ORF Transcript_24317/g.50484 Transcript_24317/m.50484 type:complete len:219 (+) Transcript_24317:282-938(+)
MLYGGGRSGTFFPLGRRALRTIFRLVFIAGPARMSETRSSWSGTSFCTKPPTRKSRLSTTILLRHSSSAFFFSASSSAACSSPFKCTLLKKLGFFTSMAWPRGKVVELPMFWLSYSRVYLGASNPPKIILPLLGTVSKSGCPGLSFTSLFTFSGWSSFSTHSSLRMSIRLCEGLSGCTFHSLAFLGAGYLNPRSVFHFFLFSSSSTCLSLSASTMLTV